MNNLIIGGIAGVFVVSGTIGVIAYQRRKRKEREIAEATEQIECELQFDDVVAYFRGLNLDKEVDTPFIANGNAEQFKSVTKGLLKPREGYVLLMLGAYNSKSEGVNYPKFIFSKGWSEELQTLLAEEAFVTLS